MHHHSAQSSAPQSSAPQSIVHHIVAHHIVAHCSWPRICSRRKNARVAARPRPLGCPPHAQHTKRRRWLGTPPPSETPLAQVTQQRDDAWARLATVDKSYSRTSRVPPATHAAAQPGARLHSGIKPSSSFASRFRTGRVDPTGVGAI